MLAVNISVTDCTKLNKYVLKKIFLNTSDEVANDENEKNPLCVYDYSNTHLRVNELVPLRRQIISYALAGAR